MNERALRSSLRCWSAALLLAFAVNASGQSHGNAPVEAVIPVEPFSSEAEAKAPAAATTTGESFGRDDNQAIASATSSASDVLIPPPDKEPFSLWDFFSRFFELGAPGDPNHPDKFKLTIGTSLGYDDNVFTTNTDQVGSGTAGINGTVSYNFGSERLRISSNLSLGVLYYDNRPGDATDYNGNFNGAVAYSVNRRLQLSLSGGVTYASQPNPTLIGGVTRFNGDYTVYNVNFGVNYSLRPRLSLRLEYHENTIQYADEDQNEALGFNDQTYVFGLDYLLTPRITLVGEYRYNPLSYYEADQDSIGQIVTVGFVTQINPRLKWTLLFGAEGRKGEGANQIEGSSSEYLGPFLESDVEYNFAPGSSLVATLRYGTEPSGIASIAIRETLRGSLVFRYAFSPRLTADVGVSYQHDNFDQAGQANDYTQLFYTGTLGLSFQVNPSISVSARYDYSAVDSDFDIDDYTRNITTLGLQIIF